ncbi:MAG TPA: PIN domain nuclease [Bacteroidales bacterium]|nr:MAG: hypothetical protein A2X11_03060 [Bacteroidetes bacterium GWE2_42_24]OFY28413.1 MAG: hypothetical protein A2X09_15015 [Bacteroidetes bacterium GWF2_43_11]HAQ65344.1 PIN domain nuclease [Bacteroidales bacterium]HBZ65459.1 PIN domain nuclease [Bacteroidales bacterium]
MKILLDTHVFIWFAEDDPRLPDEMKRIIEKPWHQVCVSYATFWKIALMVQSGELPASASITEMMEQTIDNGIEIVPLKLEHISRLGTLESHHEEIFERMLAAQALAENLIIVSDNPVYQAYGVPKLWSTPK